jgi:hypothetical protein
MLIGGSMINRMGSFFVLRAEEETGANVAQVARAYAIVREVFGVRPLWREIEALDHQVEAKVQYDAIFRKGDIAGSVHGVANVIAVDVARAIPKRDAAATIYSANVAAGNITAELQRSRRNQVRGRTAAGGTTNRGAHARGAAVRHHRARSASFGRSSREVGRLYFALSAQSCGPTSCASRSRRLQSR